MKSKLIELTDGSKLEVKVNFYTLYLVKMNGIDKKLDGRDDLTDEENMELAAKYGVMQAPTLVVVQGDQVKKYVNTSRIKQFADSFKEVLV